MNNLPGTSIPIFEYEYPSTHATAYFSTDDVRRHCNVRGRRLGLPASNRWEEAVGDR